MLKSLLSIVVIVLVMISSSGCFMLIAGAAGGAGTAIWLSNKLTQDIDKPYGRGQYAVRAALKVLRLKQTRETVDAEVSQFMAENTDGKTIWIDVRKMSEKTCRIEVRVGMLGDEEAARKIMDAITRRL